MNRKPLFNIGEKVKTPKGKGKIIKQMFVMSTKEKTIMKYQYLVKRIFTKNGIGKKNYKEVIKSE